MQSLFGTPVLSRGRGAGSAHSRRRHNSRAAGQPRKTRPARIAGGPAGYSRRLQETRSGRRGRPDAADAGRAAGAKARVRARPAQSRPTGFPPRPRRCATVMNPTSAVAGDGAMPDNVAVDHQAVKFVFAPAALNEARVQGGEAAASRGRAPRGRLRPGQQTSHKIHHRRGNWAACCGCASGARRYCGDGGEWLSGTHRAHARDPGDIGRRAVIDRPAVGCAGDSASATGCAAEPTMRAGASDAASHRFAQGRQPRRRKVRPPGLKTCR